MIVTTSTPKKTMRVYGIHWTGGRTVFTVADRDKCIVTTYPIEDVTIVDPKVDESFHFWSDSTGRQYGVLHEALLDSKLLEDLYERDPTSWDRFVARVGHEV